MSTAAAEAEKIVPAPLVVFVYAVSILESVGSVFVLLGRYALLIERGCLLNFKGGNWTNFQQTGELCSAGFWSQLIFTSALGWCLQLALCTLIGAYLRSHVFLYGMAGLGVMQLVVFFIVLGLEFGFGVPLVPYIMLSFIFIGLTTLLVVSSFQLGRVVPRPSPKKHGDPPTEEQQLLESERTEERGGEPPEDRT